MCPTFPVSWWLDPKICWHSDSIWSRQKYVKGGAVCFLPHLMRKHPQFWLSVSHTKTGQWFGYAEPDHPVEHSPSTVHQLALETILQCLHLYFIREDMQWFSHSLSLQSLMLILLQRRTCPIIYCLLWNNPSGRQDKCLTFSLNVPNFWNSTSVSYPT